ncbi:MAG: MFS transporter [Oscillospiraceae bacterium]|nr:MFS transporter [Oscillospiraceae bacterium]
MGKKIKEILGISTVSPDYLKLMVVHVCYMVFTNLHTLFVNTLFIKLTGDTNAVMKYNIVMQLFTPIFMVAAVFLMHRFSCRHSFVTGLVGYLFLYITFFTVMNHLDKYVYLISFMAAFSQAFYLMAYLSATSIFSKSGNINQTLAFGGFATGIVSLLMPYISGTIISANQGLVGYYIVFGLSTVVAGFAFYKALHLPEINFDSQKPHYGKMLKIALKDKTWHAFCASEVLKGFRGGVFQFYLSVMIYQIIQSEYMVGVNNILVGVCAILGNWFIARTMKAHNRMHIVFTSITILLAGVLFLYFNTTVATIMIFAAINSFFGCALDTGYSSMFYMAVKKTPGAEGLDCEFVNLSQTILRIGNASGILLTSVLSQSGTKGSVAALLVLVAAQYVCAFLVKIMQDRLQPGVEVFPLLDKLTGKAK